VNAKAASREASGHRRTQLAKTNNGDRQRHDSSPMKAELV
jgi:hypothetical protein